MKPRHTTTAIDSILAFAAVPLILTPFVFAMIVISLIDVGDPHLLRDLLQGVGAATAFIWIVCVGVWLPFHFSGHRHWALAILLGLIVCFLGVLRSQLQF